MAAPVSRSLAAADVLLAPSRRASDGDEEGTPTVVPVADSGAPSSQCRCVCQVIAILSLGQSTVSKHLFLLRSAGLIKDRRDRKWIHYSLDRKSESPYAARMLRNLRGWLKDDPVIAKDRERAAMARAIGPMAICERKMTLPGRPRRAVWRRLGRPAPAR